MSEKYHLDELSIALDPSHSSHILPPLIEPGCLVLDLGCGAGQTMIAAYPNATTFGLDIDLPILKFGKNLSERVQFCCGRAEELPYADEVFDFIVVRVSLAYTDIGRTLREMHRVLKPDGRIWLTLHPWQASWQLARRSNWRGQVFFLYIVANSLLLHLLQKQFSLLGKQESFQTQSGMRKLLSACGFIDIEITQGRHFLIEARSSKVAVPKAQAAGVGR